MTYLVFTFYFVFTFNQLNRTSEKDSFKEEKGLNRVSKAKARAYARKEKLELERMRNKD